MATIDDVRLPVDIERGARGGPGFKTTVISLASGDESRNREWSRVRGRWNVGYGLQKRESFEVVYEFFMARNGRHRGFRFRDWIDYKVVESPVAGSGLTRQLVRVYDDLVNPYVRNVVLPIPETLKIYKNLILTEDYTLGDNGVLTFPTDPGINVVATFEYDVPVRFDIDDLEVTLDTVYNGAIPSIPIIELR